MLRENNVKEHVECFLIVKTTGYSSKVSEGTYDFGVAYDQVNNKITTLWTKNQMIKTSNSIDDSWIDIADVETGEKICNLHSMSRYSWS
jgi:hypothetical protein